MKTQIKEIVQQLVQSRKKSKTSVLELAKWLEVDRRKIHNLESLKVIDLDLLDSYAGFFGYSTFIWIKNIK